MNQFQIELSNLYINSLALFIEGEISPNITTEFLDFLIFKTVREFEPNYTYDMYVNGDEKFRAYYENNERIHLEAKNPVEILKNGFIHNSKGCFEFGQGQLPVNHEDEEYVLCFVLTLKTQESKLHLTPLFLDYHFENSFQKNSHKYIMFLKAVINQYHNDPLINSTVQTIRDWLVLHPIALPKFNYRKIPKRPRTQEQLNSFFLSDFKKNPKYFEQNVNNWVDFFKSLKNNEFITPSATLTNFKQIFSNKEIKPENRIKWIGSNVELKWFIHLMLSEKKIEELGNELWEITIMCFINQHGENFETPQLRDANGKNMARKNLLKTIIENL